MRGLSDVLRRGDHTWESHPTADGPALFLGIQNDLFVNHIVAGRGNQLGALIAFNPAFLANNPSATFRASDGSSVA